MNQTTAPQSALLSNTVDDESHVFRVTGWHKAYQTATHGEGVYLYDQTGKRYIDAIAGTHVNTIGHGVTEIGEAMAAQAQKVAFVHKAKFTSEPQEALASMIADLAPEGMNRVSFATGGSTANEMAIQMAQYYQVEKGRHGRRKIIARWHSYHGRTIATLSLSGNLFVRRNMPLSQMDFPHIPAPTCYHCPYQKTYPSCDLACANALATTIEQEGPTSVAAFIAEPIIGGAGSAVVPPAGYYERIREICDAYDILFIAEEVITGFGRTGKNFGCDHWAATPDIITSAKALSSGYAPIAAIIVHDKICDTMINGQRQGMPTFTTYSGHPVSCAAALAVQRYVAQYDLVAQGAKVGAYLKAALKKLAERETLIGDVRGKGMMIGVEFVKNRATHQSFPRALGLVEQIVNHAFEQGLILRGQPGTGMHVDGDHILISPALIMTEMQCDELVAVFASSIEAAKAQLNVEIE
ncbi:MAG: aminotransferase family protein [bacterium]